jgi:ribosomal protein S27AE
MSYRELSDLKLERKECPRCGATWLNGAHRWATGCTGNELDLASLVCNMVDDPQCLNPKKGLTGGDTWEARRAFIDATAHEVNLHTSSLLKNNKKKKS